MHRILHVSDLHLSEAGLTDRRRLIDALLADVRHFASERPIDVVVFSGDLSFDGTEGALAQAQDQFLDPLLREIDLARDRIVLLPGNHDVCRGLVNTVVQRGLRDMLKSREDASQLLADDATLETIIERLQPWQAFHRNFYDGVDLRPATNLGWVHRLQLGSATIGIAAINTAWCSYGGPDDRGQLIVGERQCQAALTAIADCDLQVAAMHHPLDWLTPFDADFVRTEVEHRGLLVLSGHDHVEDPVGVASMRGSAIYGHAGCVYESASYRNGFSVIDVSLDDQTVTFHLRRWWPDRRCFDAAVDVVEGGRLVLTLPRRDLVVPVGQLAFSEVLAGLAETATQNSVVADLLPEMRTVMPKDVLVEPRFWSVPFQDAVAAAVTQDEKPVPADPVGVLHDGRVIIVCGEHEAGVSSALIWLLTSDFTADGHRLPALVGFDSKTDARRLERELVDAARRAGLPISDVADLPPMTVGVDDVSDRYPKALARLVRYIEEHPDHRFILGCHDSQHEAISDMCSQRDLSPRRLFLGPFGRRELRRLVGTLVGPGSNDLVDRIYGVMHGENLPRSPLIMAALTAVLAQGGELGEVNVSALLSAYVKLLLGEEELGDVEGLGMDFRRREHLLSAFAHELIVSSATRLPRLDAERLLASYFEERGFASSASPGRVLDSLITRRVLAEDRDGVGFRHDAILQLFAARRMSDDQAFREAVLNDLLGKAGIVRHAAGLRRNDRALLEQAGTLAQEAMALLGAALWVEMFDLIKDEHGWSNAPDIEDLKARLAVRDKVDIDEVDRRLDELDDQRDAVGGEEDEPEPEPSDIDRLFNSVRLLSSVLRSSELVDDVGLKTDLLKRAIHGWSLLTVVAALQEDQTASIEDMVDGLVPGEADAETQAEIKLVRQIVGLVLTFAIAFGLVTEIGSIHIEVLLNNAMADDDFMSSTAHALFATVLYCQLGLSHWPVRLENLFRHHGGHPYVATFVRVFAEAAYKSADTATADSTRLEGLLADIYTPPTRGGPAAIPARAQARGEVISELREARRRSDSAGEGLDAIASVLDDVETERGDDADEPRRGSG